MLLFRKSIKQVKANIKTRIETLDSLIQFYEHQTEDIRGKLDGIADIFRLALESGLKAAELADTTSALDELLKEHDKLMAILSNLDDLDPEGFEHDPGDEDAYVYLTLDELLLFGF